MKKNTGRSCLFCGSRPVTKEHVFSDWISKEAEPKDGFPPVEAINVTRRTTRLQPHPERLDITVKRFCTECNSGWMSRMESTIKPTLLPMMKGPSFHAELSSDQQTALAAWVYLKILAADYATVSGQRTHIPTSAYHDFYATHLPPNPGVVIWMGAHTYNITDPGAPLLTRDTLVSTEPSPGGAGSLGYVHTFCVSRVYFRVVGLLAGNLYPKQPVGDEHFGMTCIWPHGDAPAAWPRDGVVFSGKAGQLFHESAGRVFMDGTSRLKSIRFADR